METCQVFGELLNSCIALHLLEKLVEWKLVYFLFYLLDFHSLHLLEKLVEWKRAASMSDFVSLKNFEALHLLEKLVEWKRVIRLYVARPFRETLHLLEKLVEWKL